MPFLSLAVSALLAGADPAALGLGQGCTQPGAGTLLRRLLRLWCAGPVMPRFPRRSPRQPLVPPPG